jgi:NAD(P)-dependent dehydrogenase (short-subunit alcohol dehydrogenase family)
MSTERPIAVITGASAGIGKATAIRLAQDGYRVVMLVRDSEKSRAAQAEIRSASSSEDVEAVYVDLSSKSSTRAAAEELRRTLPRIDVLVNNAGVYKRTRALSADGIEMTLAVNFVAPFLLTNELLPLLEAAPAGRIVNLTSEHYRSSDLDLDAEGRFNGSKTYATSKLLVALWTRALSERLGPTGITVNCVHPGVVGTDVFREYPTWVNKLLNVFIAKPADGARPVVQLATDASLRASPGRYYYKSQERELKGLAADGEAVLQAWDMGERLTTE